MTENADLLRTDAVAPPEVDAHRFRSTFVEPIPTPVPSASPPPQELHPVSQTLAPEARDSIAPRPASVPSHRADASEPIVAPTAVTPSAVTSSAHPGRPVSADAGVEPRPASAPRHSVDTSAITLPVFAVPVGPDLPQPPERVTLDDDVLARLVTRRFDDTATVDLMAVVQAQMLARRAEAARFARWESQIRRVGTDEAALVLERTRLRFTGVIDVIGAGAPAPAGVDVDDSDTNLIPIVTPEEVAADLAARRETARLAEVEAEAERQAVEADDVRPADDENESATETESAVESGAAVESAPASESEPEPAGRAARVAGDAGDATPAVLLPASTPASPQGRPSSAPRPAETSPTTAAVESGATTGTALRDLVAGTGLALRVAVVGAAVVVLLALILAVAAGESVATAVVATLAVPVTGALAALLATMAVSARADDASVVERRRPIAVVSAVVVAAVLGFGVLSPVVAALGWQGYLVSGVGDSGPAAGAAVALALLVAAVSALVVAVLLTGVRRPSRD
jgi:hypothetical protein